MITRAAARTACRQLWCGSVINLGLKLRRQATSKRRTSWFALARRSAAKTAMPWNIPRDLQISPVTQNRGTLMACQKCACGEARKIWRTAVKSCAGALYLLCRL